MHESNHGSNSLYKTDEGSQLQKGTSYEAWKCASNDWSDWTDV